MSVNKVEASLALTYKDAAIKGLERVVYAKICPSCNFIALEWQANWRRRDAEGYLAAPPNDEIGYPRHHSDSYLFLMTRYGIEGMIGKFYFNNMPAYEDRLTDDEILAALFLHKKHLA